MLHAMIDLETLGLDDDAVIAQIAIIVFDDDRNPVTKICLNLDITAGLMDQFTVDPKTCKFWAGQPSNVKHAVLYQTPRIPPHDAAKILDKWLKETFKGKDFMVWANGILFDIPKLDNLLTRYGMKGLTERTRYSNIMDFRSVRRTAKTLYPEQFKHAENIMGDNPNMHNAEADCMWQIQMLDAYLCIMSGQYEIIQENSDANTSEQSAVIDTAISKLSEADTPPAELTETNDPLLNPPVMKDDIPEWDDQELSDDFMKHVGV